MTLFYSFSDCAEQLQWADCTFVSQRQKDVWSCCERRSGNKTLCNIFRPNWRIVLVSFVFKLPKANASANTNTNLANIQIQATIGSLSLYGIVQLAQKGALHHRFKVTRVDWQRNLVVTQKHSIMAGKLVCKPHASQKPLLMMLQKNRACRKWRNGGHIWTLGCVCVVTSFVSSRC